MQHAVTWEERRARWHVADWCQLVASWRCRQSHDSLLCIHCLELAVGHFVIVPRKVLAAKGAGAHISWRSFWDSSTSLANWLSKGILGGWLAYGPGSR